MSFSEDYSPSTIADLVRLSQNAEAHQVETVLRRGEARTLPDLAILLSPAAEAFLEQMATLAQARTRHHFGRTIRFFAPLYLSNECVNTCLYCGFSRENEIPRITLPLDQVERETAQLARQGFRSLLLVAGEHPKFVSNGYVRAAVQRTLQWMPSVSLELGPLETEDYQPLVEAGCEGLVVYQETYDEAVYRKLHPYGPKKNFHWRMDTAERAHAAGFRRIGIGALFGLSEWRGEALALASHARYLSRVCWKSQITLSFPRLRPAAGGFQTDPRFFLPDRAFVQLLTAFRLFLPHAGFVLSTREAPAFRDAVFPLGFTHMSAGSCTEPGGYSSYQEDNWKATRAQPGEQFEIADERSPGEVAAMVQSRGYEPVWKDFDTALVSDISPFLSVRSA